jgi:hypothetical protein
VCFLFDIPDTSISRFICPSRDLASINLLKSG